MLKITAIVSIMFIVVSVWASCDSCGSECAPACGTRRFRACCFNYLRKKRGSDAFKVPTLVQDVKENQLKSELPMFIVEEVPIPEQWITNALSNEHGPYFRRDILENNLIEA